MTLKIAHLNVVRGFPGLAKQLAYEQEAARALAGVEWDIYLYSDEFTDNDLAIELRWIWRGFFRRAVFLWIWLLFNHRRYDYVLVRYNPFDPFSLIGAWFVKNRIPVFHAKTVEELRLVRAGWKGIFASEVERLIGRITLRPARAVIGITDEIRQHVIESARLDCDRPSTFYPNGVLVKNITPVPDARSDREIEVAFMCGSFADWHGLDVLLDGFVQEAANKTVETPVTLHLIGNIRPRDKDKVARVQALRSPHQVVEHGVLDENAYRPIFARCHAGIGAFGLHRKGLAEAASLKVREMLALGVPVFAGHRDTAIPDDFPYFRYCQDDLLANLVEYGFDTLAVDRQTVREHATPYIDKADQLNRVVNFLHALKSARDRT